MIAVTLYSRKDCHLCESALADLESLQELVPHEVKVIDIDSDAELQEEYALEIPVVEVGPYRLKAPFTRQELLVTLGAARDRERHIEKADQAAQAGGSKVWTGADRFTYWFSRHYILILNILVLIYVGLPFLAPVLMKAGAETSAKVLYRAYSMVCHQLAYRSFFLFGEQPVYPREAAGVDGVYTFNQATGLGEGSSVEDTYAARTYIGDETVGYKVALCERDVAIYAAILLFGLVYPLTGRRLRAIPWYLWIMIGLVPIAIDGLSQLLSQPPLSFWDYRESTPALRVLTGALFGFTTAWFGYPMVEETMADTRKIMAAKWERIHPSTSVKKP